MTLGRRVDEVLHNVLGRMIFDKIDDIIFRGVGHDNYDYVYDALTDEFIDRFGEIYDTML